MKSLFGKTIFGNCFKQQGPLSKETEQIFLRKAMFLYKTGCFLKCCQLYLLIKVFFITKKKEEKRGLSFTSSSSGY
uniref:Uncharacterized protein n=1 Tax=Anguilla anguilla TaxID=7936 RepID=A0A0E9WB86_ANGAN